MDLHRTDASFGFNSVNNGGIQNAGAKRVEGSVDLAEVTDSMKGKITRYVQDKVAGYSAPGQNIALFYRLAASRQKEQTENRVSGVQTCIIFMHLST